VLVLVADLAAFAALPKTDQDRAAARVKIALGQRQRLADPESRAPQHHDQRAHPQPLRAITRSPHHSDDLLDGRRISRIAQPLIPRRATTVMTRQRRPRTPTTSSIQQPRLHHSPSTR